MVSTGNEVVKPIIPSFYIGFVDDIYSERSKFQPNSLFEAIHDFHPNIKLTIEVNLERFLYIKSF